MSKRNKIIYWIATCWLSLGMLSTGIVQLIHLEEEVSKMQDLGYSAYFLTIIGCWKLLGVLAILVPGYSLVKEWAYAGFTFDFIFACISHFAVDGFGFQTIFPLIILAILMVSYVYYHKLNSVSASY